MRLHKSQTKAWQQRENLCYQADLFANTSEGYESKVEYKTVCIETAVKNVPIKAAKQ